MDDIVRLPTLRDIAAAAGVSVATVSRALRDDHHHSPATAERIRRIANKLGYRPNPLVQALMGERVRLQGKRGEANLAIIDPRPDVPNANAMYIRGAMRRALSLGYQAEVYTCVPSEATLSQLRKTLVNGAVRGIVFMPVAIGVRRIDFDFSGFAAATIGYSIEKPRLPRVALDGQSTLFEAFARLEERGYARAGMIMAADASRRNHYLFSGACATYSRYHASRMKTSDLILEDESFGLADRKRMVAWIARNRLQAVLASAEHLIAALRDEGFRIPGDLSYVHLHRRLDDVTSMDQLRDHQGAAAVDIVTEMVQRNETLPAQHHPTIITPAVWREGSTAPSRIAIR